MIPSVSLENFKKFGETKEYESSVVVLLPSDAEVANIKTFDKSALLYNRQEIEVTHMKTNKMLYFFIPGLFSYKPEVEGDIIFFDREYGENYRSLNAKLGFSMNDYIEFRDGVREELNISSNKNYIIGFSDGKLQNIGAFEANFHELLTYIYDNSELITAQNSDKYMRRAGKIKIFEEEKKVMRDTGIDLIKEIKFITPLLTFSRGTLKNLKNYKSKK